MSEESKTKEKLEETLSKSPSLEFNTVDKLSRFGHSLAKWNQTHNLVGAKRVETIVDDHIADAIFVERALPRDLDFIIDVGTGAGFPGLVLGLLRPAMQVILVEPREKPVVFLESQIQDLGLENTRIERAKIEDLSVESYVSLGSGALITRAFSPAEELLECCAGFLASGLSLFFVGGQNSTVLQAVEQQPEKFHANKGVAYHPDHAGKQLVAIRHKSA